MSEALIDIVLFSFLLTIAFQLVRINNLFVLAMLSGIYSLVSALLFVTMDAVDVAFTEAAVGAGIATVLMLETIALTPLDEEKTPVRRPLLPLLVAIMTGAVLIIGTQDMPLYGDPSAPIHSYLAPYYIQVSGAEIGIPNIVTSVLASYRGYDTLGESFVVFTAAIGVLAITGRSRRGGGLYTVERMAILRTTATLLMPFILVFALYVQFHGDFGPGGGFQAGVIFSSAFICYCLIFGVEIARKVVPLRVLQILLSLGVTLYAGVGVAGLFFGGNFLNYSVLAHDSVHGQHLGINLIEFGVGTTVASAMISIFLVFAGEDQ